MPLLDHFRPPLYPRRHWESFHATWAGSLADALNQRLPETYFAEEFTHAGVRLEIDVATYEENVPAPGPSSADSATATLPAAVWAPPAPAWSIPAIFLDTFEVRVFAPEGGLTLVAAIELISPGNKDRLEERQAFAAKCASYLCQGVSLIIMDIVTTRHANLHNQTMQLMAAPEDVYLPGEVALYAVAYRPVLRQEKPELDIWPAPFAVGERLPLLPLRLTGDLFVPVDFEAAYQDACRRRRLV